MMAHSQPLNYWQSRFWRRSAWPIFAGLALISLILVLYLGSHSRIKGDDFCHLSSGLEYGPWGNLLYWRNSFNGSYSYYFLHGLTAPLDTLAPLAFVAINIVAWLFGLAWLIVAGRRFLGGESLPLAPVTLVAAALLWFTIYGLVTQHSIYFYSAATRHTLPIAALLIALAACCEFLARLHSTRGFALGCLIFALFAFVNAGMAEVFAVLQLALFTALLAAAYMMIPQAVQRKCYAIIISGWAANCLALITMLSAPGVARRLASFKSWTSMPQRSYADMLHQSLEHIQSLFIDAELNAGFFGMFFFGVFMTLAFRSPHLAPPLPSRRSFQLAALPLWLGFLGQLLLALVLWSGLSANPLAQDRLSPVVAVAVGVNALLLLNLGASIVARRELNAYLLDKPSHWAAMPILTLGMIVLLFGLAQLDSIAPQAATIILVNKSLLIFILLWQFNINRSGTRKAKTIAPAVWGFLVMCMSAAVVVGVGEVIRGRVYLYTLSFLPFASAFTGFLWGLALASAIHQIHAATPATRATRLLMSGSAGVAIAIWVASLAGYAGNIPQFEQYSQAWDERHELILARRDSGVFLSKVPELTVMPDILDYSRELDYWQASCASDDITAFLEERYRA